MQTVQTCARATRDHEPEREHEHEQVETDTLRFDLP